MILSAELFDQVLETLARQKGSQNKRRAQPRIGFWASTVFHLYDGERVGPPLKARVRDISAGGINLLTSLSLKIGNQFYIDLPRPPAAAMRLLFITKHVREVAEGLFSIGAELLMKMDVDWAPPAVPSSGVRASG